MSDSFWVDPERLGRSGDGYADAKSRLDNVANKAGDISLRYSDRFGNDEEGQKFRDSFDKGMQTYTGGVLGISGKMDAISMGLRQNGEMYGGSRDSADDLTYNLMSETDHGGQPTPGQPPSDSFGPPSSRFSKSVKPDDPEGEVTDPEGDGVAPLSQARMWMPKSEAVSPEEGSGGRDGVGGGSEFDSAGDPNPGRLSNIIGEEVNPGSEGGSWENANAGKVPEGDVSDPGGDGVMPFSPARMWMPRSESVSLEEGSGGREGVGGGSEFGSAGEPNRGELPNIIDQKVNPGSQGVGSWENANAGKMPEGQVTDPGDDGVMPLSQARMWMPRTEGVSPEEGSGEGVGGGSEFGSAGEPNRGQPPNY
ncbi:hypothetical protein OOZ19_16065 [Saccharopolyspora sp. NFXS83]|uniref:hypothetical protein n=1 Tax=Saccharopolyspora sp. NFXS83 TaxID=2993560 RepID=UPI00224AFD3B|nr:hypothetical protein [Saccharopolyspora sp. NFXS83]MCX2731758.1 hypothetical protein [Saccharopolyspora sp. NFXS83]